MVEICCGSVYDAIVAYKAGADRIELNSAVALGGLTPTMSVIEKVMDCVKCDVVVMIRCREAGFVYSDVEKEVMLNDAKQALELGVHGIVFGALNDHFQIDIEFTRAMVELIHSYHAQAIFHRAFDMSIDAFKAIEDLIFLKVDRVLTSGQKAKCTQGLDLLKELNHKYGTQIELLVGSGLNDQNVQEIMAYTNIQQVHASCKVYILDENINSSEEAYNDGLGVYKTSFELVEKLVVKVQTYGVNKKN